jgi:predicted  nucleic acid-binding Zn-ribbon protein
MDRGLVTNPKDLERMQEELVSLARRIGSLEDTELEVMEQLESAQQEQAQLSARLAEIDARTAELSKHREVTAGDTTSEAASATEQRAVIAADLPVDLMTLYERIRTQRDGVGAAALRQRRCGGCRLELTASDLGVIAKATPDEVIRCEECSRILVRTPESGL